MTRYRSFLLRVWTSSRKEDGQWAAQVEDLQTQERLRFQNQAALLSYLLDVVCQPAGAPSHSDHQEDGRG